MVRVPLVADPVTWRDVLLSLSGAPVGAAIAVLGVHLTNRHNDDSQRRLIDAQAAQHRAQLEADLRSSLQKQTLSTRSELYEALLAECDRALNLASWATGEGITAARGAVDDEDLLPLWTGVRNLRFRTLVHCSAPVRYQVDEFADAVSAVNETSPAKTWDGLVAESKALQQAIIEAAVADRSGGVAEDGLGGM